MKKILTILIILSLPSCYVYDTGYVNPRRDVDTYWDPIYSSPYYRFNGDVWLRDHWSDQRLDNLYYYRRNGNNFLYNPYYGRLRPVIVYKEKERPTPPPQRPRVENLRPGPQRQPQPTRPQQSPIRTFPKKDDSPKR
jgi:hypothetical protein